MDERMNDAAPESGPQSGPESAPARRPRRPARGRRLPLVLGVAAAAVLVLLAVIYLNRRAATRQVLIGWLEQQGIDADMQVERVELDGLVASIRIGDPADPDVTVERVEVDYAIGAPVRVRSSQASRSADRARGPSASTASP
jgi:hypothetical protein